MTTGLCHRGVLLGGCTSDLAARGRSASIMAPSQASLRALLYGRLVEMTFKEP